VVNQVAFLNGLWSVRRSTQFHTSAGSQLISLVVCPVLQGAKPWTCKPS